MYANHVTMQLKANSASSVGNPKILVVEDNAEFRDAMVEIIRGEGYEVETATSGLEALDKLRWGLRPCLVLLDLQMRVMTGWDFGVERKKNPVLAKIPVIAMTAGYWKEQDIRDFTACIEKPIDLNELRSILQRYCPSTQVPA